MLELKGLKGEELREAYIENIEEFERIVVPYGVRDYWWLQREKAKPDGELLQYFELIDEKYVGIFREKYEEYVLFRPKGRRTDLCLFLEGYGGGANEVRKATVDALERWLRGRGD